MSRAAVVTCTFVSAVFIGILGFIYLPALIYAANPTEFRIPFSELSIHLLKFSLAVVAILLLPTFLLRVRIAKTYAACISALGMMFWISAVFVVNDFGVLDGASFNLTRHGTALLIQTVLLGLLFGLVLWFCIKQLKLACQLLALLCLGLLFSAYSELGSSRRPEPVQQASDLTTLARFSQDTNLLIILMDTFQSDVLDYLLKEDETLADELTGFHFYPDTLGVAPSTYLTMPALHSGEQYNEQISLQEYYQQGVYEGSFLNALSSAGFQTDIINPIARVCPKEIDACIYDDSILSNRAEEAVSDATLLADLGVFRMLPGLTKQLAFDGTRGMFGRLFGGLNLNTNDRNVYQSNQLLDWMTQHMHVDNGMPTARLIHLFNTHPPYMFDEQCGFTGISKRVDRAGMHRQTACAMSKFVQLLEQMKQKGIYDNSMIVLVADTGVGTAHGNDDLSNRYATADLALRNASLGRLMGGANPVLAIKYRNADQPLKVASVPAQLIDIPKTVCGEFGSCNSDHGINLSSDLAIERVRRFHYYSWRHEYWGLDKIPGIVSYEVGSPLWDEENWDRVLGDQFPESISGISFSEADNSALFGLGWSYVETSQDQSVSKRWALGEAAELFVPIELGVDRIFEFTAISAPNLPSQSVTLWVDGKKIQTEPIEPAVQTLTYQVPASAFTQSPTRLRLEFENYRVAADSDLRKVAVAFYQLDIR